MVMVSTFSVWLMFLLSLGESIPVGNIISMGTSAAPFSFSLKFVGVIEGKSLQTYYTLYHIMNSNCNLQIVNVTLRRFSASFFQSLNYKIIGIIFCQIICDKETALYKV